MTDQPAAKQHCNKLAFANLVDRCPISSDETAEISLAEHKQSTACATDTCTSREHRYGPKIYHQLGCLQEFSCFSLVPKLHPCVRLLPPFFVHVRLHPSSPAPSVPDSLSDTVVLGMRFLRTTVQGPALARQQLQQLSWKVLVGSLPDNSMHHKSKALSTWYCQKTCTML